MRYKPGHREESRERILSAVGRGFRKHGYEGIGVDGLAKEAGVTSGAFYGHFPSKEAAFREVVVHGLEELHEGVERLQKEYGSRWVGAFIDFYLDTKRTCDLGEACALQALTSEVVRSSASVRANYRDEFSKVLDAVALGLTQDTVAERRERAWALMSLLSGGVTIARALGDDALALEAAKALRSAAIAIVT
ncbi:MAG: TetR/AcrR family transcriptional regulator [Burkholderiales bacterium]|nr:TetR/AcrR family transcriptional regulator [Burkholderiales bacterium]